MSKGSLFPPQAAYISSESRLSVNKTLRIGFLQKVMSCRTLKMGQSPLHSLEDIRLSFHGNAGNGEYCRARSNELPSSAEEGRMRDQRKTRSNLLTRRRGGAGLCKKSSVKGVGPQRGHRRVPM